MCFNTSVHVLAYYTFASGLLCYLHKHKQEVIACIESPQRVDNYCNVFGMNVSICLWKMIQIPIQINIYARALTGLHCAVYKPHS